MTQHWLRLMKRYTTQVWATMVLARAAHACVNLLVTDWVMAQQEDPIINTMIDWISNQ